MNDNNILFFNENISRSKIDVKRCIVELSKKNKKIILLDSFWSKEKYSRFLSSPYKENIEKKYHIKLSVEDFLNKDNLIDYMNAKGVNIVKLKSIVGFMSAAELFPVIISKLNTIDSNEEIYVLLNDHILDSLDFKEVIDSVESVDKNKVKFIVLSSKEEACKKIIKNNQSIAN